MTYEIIDAALREDPTVFDCAVLPRESSSGRADAVAYVVPTGSLSLSRLRQSLINRLGADAAIPTLVAIPTMPLTPEGHADLDALHNIAVLDEATLSGAEQQVSALPGVRRAAAVAHSRVRVSPPLHLSDLLPGWSRSTAAETTVASSRLVATAAVAETAPLALADGGEPCRSAGGPELLADMLAAAAGTSAADSIVCIESDGSESAFSHAELLRAAQRVLGGLQQAGLRRGDTLILHLRRNRDFLDAFWGCILGGIVPVPIPAAPNYDALNGNVRRLGDARAMLANPLIVSNEEMLPDLRRAMRLLGVNDARLAAVESLRRSAPAAAAGGIEADDVALMVLTSGSTGRPKGVPLRHRNLVAQCLGTRAQCGYDEQTVALNWMPLDHVAGLIFLHLGQMASRRQIHVATDRVLRDPLSWLDLIDRHRASASFAPNFAFGLVCGLADEIGRRSWDLSSMRCIVNAGEPIVAASALRFMRLLAPHGLRGDSMAPAFGMSETSSGIGYWRGFGPGTVADNDPCVPLGSPIAGARMRIVDESGQLMREGQTGQLQVAGATLFPGYYGNQPPREEVFTADGWFRTGDLARIDRGVLSITGRDKDVIIVNGVNFSGPAIENMVEDLGVVARSFTAACGVADPRAGGGEGLALFFVPSDEGDAALDAALRLIRQRMVHDFGIAPVFLVPLLRDDIPKTSLGKIQRAALQKALAAGRFDVALKRVDILTGSDNTLPPWFFRRRWQRKDSAAVATPPRLARVLLFGDGGVLATAVYDRLAKVADDVVCVHPGSRFERLAADRFVVDAASPQGLQPLMQALATGAGTPLSVVYLWNAVADAVDENSHASRHAARACARLAAVVGGLRHYSGAVTLAVVSRGAGNMIDLSRAAVCGLVSSISRESSTMRALHVDTGVAEAEAAAAAIVGELAAGTRDGEVVYRNGQRGVPVLESFLPRYEPGTQPVLRRGGRYLVIGGLGGVGSALAAWLLREFGARLLLVGRAAAEQQVSTLQRLRELSPDVTYVQADAADEDALRAAVVPVLAGWGGPLDAVFHLAAVFHERAVAGETEAGLLAQLRPKIDGALALLKLAREHDGAALVLFSSIVGLFGGAQVGAYAAASRCLDELCGAGGPTRVFTIDWSAWRDTGLNRQYGALEPLRAIGGVELTPEQALSSLRIALLQPPGQIIIGLDARSPFVARHCARLDLEVRIEVFFEGDAPAESLAADGIRADDRFGTQVRVSTTKSESLPVDEHGHLDRAALTLLAEHKLAFRAPGTVTEVELSELWSRILGVDAIGADASFFELGGQSLLATQLLSAIGERFGVRWTLRDVFAAPTLAAQAERIDADAAQAVSPRSAAAPSATPAAVRVFTNGRALPIGSGQQRLWFLDRIDPHNAAYNVYATITFDRFPDPEAVRGCLQGVVDRHEGLRTRFPLVDGQPCQWVESRLDVVLPVIDVASQQDLEAAEQAEARRTFELASGPLLRTRLLRLADGRGRLQITMHHSIADGWSMKVIYREFMTLFAGASAAELPPMTRQYADFAAWQQARLDAGELDLQIEHWRTRLASNLNGLTLAGDFARPAAKTHRGVRLMRPLPVALARRVRALARQRSVTPFVLLLAGFKALLAVYSQQDDIIVGAVVANRNRAEFSQLIGFIVNMLTLRTDLGGDPSFVDIVQRVQNVLLDAHANQDVPFETLVDRLQPPRDPGRSPLFQIAIDLRDADISRSTVEGLSLAIMEPDLGASQYDLHLTLEEKGAGLGAIWQFNADLFATSTIERMAANFEALLDAVTERPDCLLSRLPLPGSVERSLIQQWNRTERPYPRETAVHELFEAQVRASPDSVAVEHGAERVTYLELNARANRLAQHLRRLGVGPEVMVGLSFERSVDLIVAMLGILKAGGAYVPLDPEYPSERLNFMLGDTAAPVVVTHAAVHDKLPRGDARHVVLDHDWAEIDCLAAEDVPSGVNGGNLAYVIYTSGSTGTPKGVQVLHRSINRLVCNTEYVKFDSSDRVAQVSVVSFDAATFEIWGALLHGGRLVIVPREVALSPPALASFLREHGITVMFLTAVLFDRVAHEVPDAFAGMRYMVYGGAAAEVESLRAVLRHGAPRHLVNGYGPTEVTTFAVTNDVREVEDGATMVPIGRPIANTTAYVLGRFGEWVPIGVTGELCLGGDGVARGYLNRPELNAEHFVLDPFSGRVGDRLYRTGDMVRQKAGGEIEFLGRTDQQIKLRGFRVELGEIEVALRGVESVREAVVVVRTQPDGDPSLAAYVTAAPGQAAPSADALRQRLRDTLPAYMVPASFVVLDHMPLSPNGKIDRAALPDPRQTSAPGSAGDRPRGEIERVIADAWSKVLGGSLFDRRTNFFDAGGHSLKTAQIHTLLVAQLNCEVSLIDLFRFPTIETLAAHLAKTPRREAAPASVTAVEYKQ